METSRGVEIADPNFLVAKPKKPRTPAQVAATEKGLAALKARRAELTQKVDTLKAKGPAPVKPVKAVAKPSVKAAAPAPVVAVEEESSSEEEVPPPPPTPVAKKAKSVPVPAPAVAPPQFDPESLISAISQRVSESLAKKKKTKRVVYEEESSSEEEVVVRKPKAKAVPVPAAVPVEEPPKPPRVMPAHFAKSTVLSRLFSV
jgi:hypothetical protein